MPDRLSAWRTPLVILVCGCLIGLLGFGPRSTFGFFLGPMSNANGWGRDVFALALAIEMLLWGATQPFAGALADRFGAVWVLAGGAVLYAAGIVWMAYAQTPLELHLSAGVLIGLGLGGCSFTLVIGAFGKLLPDSWRTIGFGAGTAAGSFGQFLFSPLAVALVNEVGWQQTLLIFGGVYAAGVFGWGALDMLVYGIVLSVFAVLGGFLGGWLDDTFGSKAAILTSIGGTTLGLVLAVSITPDEIFFQPYPDAQPVWSLPFFQTLPEMLYLGVVLLIAIFITAAYANSRTMLARIAPATMMTEFFGLYALSGTATAFVAPILVGWSTDVFDSQRAGFASILVLLIAGMVVMLYVREVRAERAPEDR